MKIQSFKKYPAQFKKEPVETDTKNIKKEVKQGIKNPPFSNLLLFIGWTQMRVILSQSCINIKTIANRLLWHCIAVTTIFHNLFCKSRHFIIKKWYNMEKKQMKPTTTQSDLAPAILECYL